jgi:hypothetical protein
LTEEKVLQIFTLCPTKSLVLVRLVSVKPQLNEFHIKHSRHQTYTQCYRFCILWLVLTQLELTFYLSFLGCSPLSAFNHIISHNTLYTITKKIQGVHTRQLLHQRQLLPLNLGFCNLFATVVNFYWLLIWIHWILIIYVNLFYLNM